MNTPKSQRVVRYTFASTIGTAVLLIIFFLLPGSAPLLAQLVVPDLDIVIQSDISVTIVLEDGQTIIVPIDLTTTTNIRNGGGVIKVEADTLPQPGMVIQVEASREVSASIRALAHPTVTPTDVAVIPPTSTPFPTPTPTLPSVAPTATPAQTVAGSTYRIGDDVMTGDIKWRVISVEDLGNRLTSDNMFVDDAVTNGRFIRVVVEVDNRGSDPASYWTPELLDSQDRKFNGYSGQYFFIPDEQECVFLVLNPGLSKQCTHIYEVASDTQDLKLKVTDFALFFGNEAIIELR